MTSLTPWDDAPSHKTWKAGIPAGVDPEPGSGALRGKQLEPWYIAKLVYEAGWNDTFEVMTSVQVCLAESQGYTMAIHVNKDGSRDRGIWQLNDIHAWITDEMAYDPVRATAAAFKLFVSDNGWSPWAAYEPSGVFLHDSYLGRASRGVGNYIARATLEVPVPDWAGKPYVHRYAGSILNYEHRLSGCLHNVEQAKKDLGWQSATAAKVKVVQTDLAHAVTAAKAPLPTS